MSLGLCLGKAVVPCPNCGRQIEATRPEASSPCWSLNKPSGNDVVGKPKEQTVQCSSPDCEGKVRIYWHNKKIFLQ